MSPARTNAILIGIIVVLVCVLLFAFQRGAAEYFTRKREQSNRDHCQRLLMALEDGLKMYQYEFGSLPPSSPGLGSLSKIGGGSYGPVQDVDPWKRPIVYRSFYGTAHRMSVIRGARLHGLIELYSVGPNGIDEQGDGDDVRVGD